MVTSLGRRSLSLSAAVLLVVGVGAFGVPATPRSSGLAPAPPIVGTGRAALPIVGTGRAALPTGAARAAVLRAYGNLPLAFERNRGQAGGVDYLARGDGYAVGLGATGVTIALTVPPRPLTPQLTNPAGARLTPGVGARARSRGEGKQPLMRSAKVGGGAPLPRQGEGVGVRATLRLRFVGVNPRARAEGLDRLPGDANYYIGRDARRWRTSVPTYARVAYRDVYPGVDLVYYGTGRRLEYDAVLAPGADPRRIALAFAGARIDRAGDLALPLPGGVLRQAPPVVYQQVDGVRRAVSARYVARGRAVGIAVGAYDRSRPLVVDPALSYATYLGGNSTDDGAGVAVDSSGDAYVVGTTNSTNFPTTPGAAQASNSAVDNVFVAKLNPAGNALLYSTYLGGNGGDVGTGIALDAAGDAYVAGYTNSTNFPTVNAYQGAKSGGNGNVDAFVSKLNPAGGALLYSTYLGGSLNDEALGVAADGAGNAYVTGFTYSSNFPTMPGAAQGVYNNGGDAFVARINTGASGGASLLYSTYLGGGSADFGHAIAVDGAGVAYVTGSTMSADFPTRGAAQGTLASVSGSNAFVTKVNAAGSALSYSTYLGGGGSDAGNGIAVDGAGAAYVAGATSSTDFPTTGGALQRAFAGGPGNGDAFVTKLNGSGNGLAYSTYLGGSGEDEGLGIALDAAGDANVAGRTVSADFPTANAPQGAFGAKACAGGDSCTDAFVAALNPGGGALLYGAYLGGNDEDEGAGIAVDQSGAAYVTGATFSTAGFPASNGPPSKSATDSGASSAFVAKIASAVQVAPSPTPSATRTSSSGGGTLPSPTTGAGNATPTPTRTTAPGAPSPTSGPGRAPSATPPGPPTATTAPGAPSSTPGVGTTPGATATAAQPTATPANSATAAAQATGAAIVRATATSVAAATATASSGGAAPTAAPGPPDGLRRPSIALTPSSVRVGGRVVVSGSGFRPGEDVTLSLDGEALAAGRIVVGRDGRFTAAFVAPDSLLQGSNAVGALGTSGDMSMATLLGIVGVASRYYIAGGVNASSERSSLVVLNPSGRSATLRLAFYFADGVVRRRTLGVRAHAELVAPIGDLRLPPGDFGLALTADRRVAAGLAIARPGRDGDSIPGNTGAGRTWYLAEGYTGLTFRETVSILNTGARPARVGLQLSPSGGRRGRTVVETVPPRSERAYDVNRLLPRASLSIVARSDQPVVVERTLRFGRDGHGRDYGETARAGGGVAASSWLLAEGTTANHFQTFLTVLNPGDRRVSVTATFFGGGGRALGRRTMVMAARSRGTSLYNKVVRGSGIAAMVEGSGPVIVERPEYLGSPNGTKVAGSAVFGRNGVATRWTFPGGDAASRSEFYLLYNPSARAARVRATLYNVDGRTVSAVVAVAPHARYTLDAGRVFRGFSGAHGATLEALNGVGFVAEQTVFARDRSTLQSAQGLAQ